MKAAFYYNNYDIRLNDIPKPNELISELNNMVEKNDNKIQDKSGETSSDIYKLYQNRNK